MGWASEHARGVWAVQTTARGSERLIPGPESLKDFAGVTVEVLDHLRRRIDTCGHELRSRDRDRAERAGAHALTAPDAQIVVRDGDHRSESIDNAPVGQRMTHSWQPAHQSVSTVTCGAGVSTVASSHRVKVIMASAFILIFHLLLNHLNYPNLVQRLKQHLKLR